MVPLNMVLDVLMIYNGSCMDSLMLIGLGALVIERAPLDYVLAWALLFMV